MPTFQIILEGSSGAWQLGQVICKGIPSWVGRDTLRKWNYRFNVSPESTELEQRELNGLKGSFYQTVVTWLIALPFCSADVSI